MNHEGKRNADESGKSSDSLYHNKEAFVIMVRIAKKKPLLYNENRESEFGPFNRERLKEEILKEEIRK